MADKKRNPLQGFAYISRNPKAQDDAKQPLFKGFVSVTPELLEKLLSLPVDDYGNVKLDLALWASQDKKGVLTGSVKPPYEAPGSSTPKPSKKPAHSFDQDEDDIAF